MAEPTTASPAAEREERTCARVRCMHRGVDVALTRVSDVLTYFEAQLCARCRRALEVDDLLLVEVLEDVAA